MKTNYQCECCLKEYGTPKEAYKCEADCLGLTEDEYGEYVDLLVREKQLNYLVSRTKTGKSKKMLDDCIKDILDFQEKHKLTNDKRITV